MRVSNCTMTPMGFLDRACTWAASVWTRSVLLGAGPFRAAVRPVIAFPCALFLAAVFAIMLATGGQV